jgi:hypothetical protein
VPVTTCIHPRHGQEPPLADEPLMLCHHCHGRLRRDLDALIALWPLLDEMVTPGNNGSGGGAAGKPGSRPPCDLDAIDARDNATAVIGSWARVVIEDRQLSGRGSLDGESAARLLVIHLEWLTAQPFADDAATEVADVVYLVRRACRDLGRAPIGTCRAVDPREPSKDCGGPLYWIDTSMQVRCSRCHDTWNEADLQAITAVVEVWVPIADAAALMGLTVRTINRYAEAGHIRRRRGRVVYSEVVDHVRSSA